MFDFIRGTTKPNIKNNIVRYCPDCHKLRRWKRLQSRFGYINKCCGYESIIGTLS